jgi:hypothetical protein
MPLPCSIGILDCVDKISLQCEVADLSRLVSDTNNLRLLHPHFPWQNVERGDAVNGHFKVVGYTVIHSINSSTRTRRS